jgi:hypothetical protein
MTRKLHNTISALVATSGLLVLSLMAASPLPTDPAERSWSSPGQIVQVEATTLPSEASAQAIEARAQTLEARIEASASAAEAIALVAGFTAEAASAAMLAEAFDAAKVDPGSKAEAPRAGSKPRRSHQTVAMPFFSFAPRG